MKARQLMLHPAERLGFLPPFRSERFGVGDCLAPAIFGNVGRTVGAERRQRGSVGAGIALRLQVVDAGHLSTRDCFSFGARQALIELQDCGALFEAVKTGFLFD